MTPDPRIPAFVVRVLAEGEARYRDLPWRRTRDPYAVLVSEVMLQQTQVSRVFGYYTRWIEEYPTLEALAAAPLEAVLRSWQGLGYNRRAVALKNAAQAVVDAQQASGSKAPAALPKDEAALVALPGVGPATAAGVRSFAFGEMSAYLETNVRTVFLHELFADATDVADKELLPLVRQAAQAAKEAGVDARQWNFALLDYGAHLKRTVPNPSRRSAHHARQSLFEGSRRQKRSRLLRTVMEAPGISAEVLAEELGVESALACELLEELAAEGFLVSGPEGWSVAP